LCTCSLSHPSLRVVLHDTIRQRRGMGDESGGGTYLLCVSPSRSLSVIASSNRHCPPWSASPCTCCCFLSSTFFVYDGPRLLSPSLACSPTARRCQSQNLAMLGHKTDKQWDGRRSRKPGVGHWWDQQAMRPVSDERRKMRCSPHTPLPPHPPCHTTVHCWFLPALPVPLMTSAARSSYTFPSIADM